MAATAIAQAAQIGILILAGQTTDTSTEATELMPSKKPPPCEFIPMPEAGTGLCNQWATFGLFWQDAAYQFYEISERERYEKLTIAGDLWRAKEQVRILTENPAPDAPIPPDIWFDKWPWLLAGGLGLLGTGVVLGLVVK